MADFEVGQIFSSGVAGASVGSSAGPWGAAAGALIGAAGNVISQLFTNKANRDLQRESWDRMSISSRIKELEKNGLNKLFAAGSMPSYNLSTSMKSPDINVGAAINAYEAAKQIQLLDVNTKNAVLQNRILENNYSSSRSQAIIDRINENIARGDYSIVNFRQNNGIKSTDNSNLQDVGFLEKLTGVKGSDAKTIWNNFLMSHMKENDPRYEDVYSYYEDVPSAEKGSPIIYDDQNDRYLYLDEEKGEYYYLGKGRKRIYSGVYSK